MESLAAMVTVKYIVLRDCLIERVHNFLYDERGDVNIVSIVVLIAIAIVLAVFFREQIEGIITSLFTQINSGVENATSENIGMKVIEFPTFHRN